ncbi:hypothetical protein ACFSSB_15575 [Lacinutrix gracilariae]|uniref:Lipoprotein n=1 Tax=Lacinutrix gracilariae TaxID=1747198 RepID=A0ABW5K4I4_9FLAO
MKKTLRNITAFNVILILAVFFHSCASFDKELINPNPLKKESLNELNGKYGIVHNEFDSIHIDKEHNYNRQIWNSNNFFTEIDRKLIKDTLKIDTLNTYSFNLRVLSPKKLKVEYLENGKIFRERILKTKLKRDGYLYLRNKNTQFMLIPIIAGTIDIKKTRLTKTEKGTLVFDVANFRYFAALIFIGDTRTWKYRQEYEQIE